jgi:hypothetical protein
VSSSATEGFVLLGNRGVGRCCGFPKRRSRRQGRDQHQMPNRRALEAASIALQQNPSQTAGSESIQDVLHRRRQGGR